MQSGIEAVLIDVGNSAVKATAVVDGRFSTTKRYEELSEALKAYEGVPGIVSSVRKVDEKALGVGDYVLLSNRTKLPIQLDYKTPESLGSDRIAAAVGATVLFPGKDNLVIDLGTCMTLDLVSKEGVFCGGIISPGLRMRMKSMAAYTANLPDISKEWESIDLQVLGKSTKECLLSGSLKGMEHEIKGVIGALSRDFTSLNIIISGGDADFFESKLKAHIFAGSKIVHEGLYRIWKFQ